MDFNEENSNSDVEEQGCKDLAITKAVADKNYYEASLACIRRPR